MRHRAALLGPVVTLLVVAACGGTTMPSSSDSETPTSVVTVASEVPRTTLGPDRAALAEFESHLRLSVAREGNLVQELAKASVGTADELRTALDHARTWVEAERAWLATHPTATCYAAAGTALAAAAKSMSDAIDGFAGAAAGRPNPSDDVTVPSAEVAIGNALQDVRTQLNTASVNAAAARTSCS